MVNLDDEVSSEMFLMCKLKVNHHMEVEDVALRQKAEFDLLEVERADLNEHKQIK